MSLFFQQMYAVVFRNATGEEQNKMWLLYTFHSKRKFLQETKANETLFSTQFPPGAGVHPLSAIRTHTHTHISVPKGPETFHDGNT